MKKLVLSFAAIAMIFASCEEKDEVVVPRVPVVGEITGDITANTTIAYGNYTMKGIVKVKSGAVLTIEAGSTITSTIADGSIEALVVEKGGKVMINGTAAEPVVFTESSKTPGSWGGIIMYGDAPIVAVGGVVSATSEDGLGLKYGGANETDSSGTMKYVRVEYAGKKITDGTSEMNGFSFYSVGSGTVLENLVAYKGADDGFEFYGGTVNLINAISYGNYDDSFDWQDGWKGQLSTNWYAFQVGTGNFGMEIEAKNNNNNFWPKVSNITLRRAADTGTENNAAEYDAIQFKNDGNGEYSNILIEGYSNAKAVAVRINDVNTNTNQVLAGKLKIKDLKIVGTTPIFGGTTKVADEIVVFGANLTTSTTAKGASLVKGAWAVVGTDDLLAKL